MSATTTGETTAEACGTADGATGMADAMLEEIAEMLGRLVETGETASIDMRGLPLSDTDRAILEQRLGQGEVSAVLSVAGRSEVWETAISGVWWVRHLGTSGGTAAEHIVVSRIPDILATNPDDARAGLARLRDMLDASRSNREQPSTESAATEDAA